MKPDDLNPVPQQPSPAAAASAFNAAWRLPEADADPQETAEWLESLEQVIAQVGPGRATFLLKKLLQHARARRVPLPQVLATPYVNTISLADQPPYPGNLETEARLSALVRWNALAMVVRANRASAELGGHIASYASAADLFEVGFNHFFRGADAGGGDLVYFQPHSAPGVYARAFLEGRLTEEQLAHYRREADGRGLSSYPHPWLMKDFWQFPTGSMGLGPLFAIYQARFMQYLAQRGLAATAGRKVWAFVGDGEMDEPESLAGLSIAAREGLDNLVFVVNCNLQRLDGPVRGNGSIIQELEGLFAGAGWNVIKLLWGSDWDPLFARDTHQLLLRALHETVDGEFQTLAATDGRFNREHFFAKNPELQQLVSHLSDDDIDRLRRGGHDPVKIFSAYWHASRHRGQPTVILAKTKKGYGMGSAGQGRMTTHQQKKLDAQQLMQFRDRFALPLSDAQVQACEFVHPGADSPEMKYLHARRAKLGGYLPARASTAAPLAPPPLADYARFALQADGKEMSTTMALVRMISGLLKDKAVGPRIVPIIADEARTFGMADLFRQIGIYSPLRDAADVHLLLDLRLPARGRCDLGGGRLARARLSLRRHRRPHHAVGRRAAAPGRLEPSGGRHLPQLPRLRPLLCLRAGSHRARRHAAHAGRAGGRVLLCHGDERELRAAVGAVGADGRAQRSGRFDRSVQSGRRGSRPRRDADR